MLLCFLNENAYKSGLLGVWKDYFFFMTASPKNKSNFAGKHCYNKGIIYQTQMSLLVVL